MAAPHDANTSGERVEALLAELQSRAGPRAGAVAEELVTCLVGLYGAGLGRIAAILAEDGDRGLLDRLAADPLVESLLLIHDLHPLDTRARVKRALAGIGTAATIEYLGVDDRGMVRLRLERNGHACSSPADAIRQAVTAAAPETAGVDIEEVAAPAPLLQITRRPAGAR